MKILFIGVLDIPWSSNTSMTKELRNLGHDVIDFNYRTISQNFFQNESLIKKNIEKLFQSRSKNLDAKLWIQKAILKKYLKNN